ncbi:tRNA-guanine transglycosylase [Escherichia coli]
MLHLSQLLHALTCIILTRCNEILGARLNTIHNLRYYQRLMAGLRKAIEEGKLESFVTDFYQRQGREVPPLNVD